MIVRMLQDFKFVSFVVVVLRFSVLQSVAVGPGTLTLAWDPSSDPSVVGYRLYDGIASENYTNMMDVGSNLTATVSGLVPGATYIFAVTAYDNAGLESLFSGQISYTVPATAPLPPVLPSLFIAQNSSGLSVLSGIGPAGYAYDIYASMDFSSWLVVGTVTMDSFGTFQFTDSNSQGIPSRFYRLRQSTPLTAY